MTAIPESLHPGLTFDRCKQLAALDEEWQEQRMRWLDWDQEPRPLSVKSVALTSAWFIVLWGMLQVIHSSMLCPIAATASILILNSPRGKNFDAAFRAYQRRRMALSLPSMMLSAAVFH